MRARLNKQKLASVVTGQLRDLSLSNATVFAQHYFIASP